MRPIHTILAVVLLPLLAGPALALNIIGGPAAAPSAPEAKNPWKLLPALGEPTGGPVVESASGSGVVDPTAHANPEPTTLVIGLLGMGLVGVWRVRRGHFR